MRAALAVVLVVAGSPPAQPRETLQLAQVNLSGSATAATETQACLGARRAAELACIRIGRDAVFAVPCVCRPGAQGMTCAATTECIPKY